MTAAFQKRGSARRGTLLVVVLVVVAMVSLGSYALVESMYIEHKGAQLHGDRLQRQQALSSAVERLAAVAEMPAAERQRLGGLVDNPVKFHNIPLRFESGGTDRPDQLYASIIAPQTGAFAGAAERFGASDESSRLNLAAVMQWEQQHPGAGRAALLHLPGMTEPAADAILDWLDADAAPRPLGAEGDYYAGMDPPYAARNAVPTDLRELLLVRHVTPQLLFGGPLAEPAMAYRATSMASHSHSAMPARPWSDYLTLWSGERQLGPDGKPRIDLNGPDLALLQQQLSTTLDSRMAQFIVAYRQYGPYLGPQPGDDAANLPVNSGVPARFALASPLDLVGARVAFAAPGSSKPTVYASPLGADHAQGSEPLLRLFDTTTVGAQPVVRGRINVNEAPVEVLQAIPGLNAAHLQALVSARGEGRGLSNPARRHAVWLWAEGLLDLDTMKRLLPYVNGGGDVFRARAVISDRDGVQLAAADVVVDATTSPARVRSFLTEGLHPETAEGEERGPRLPSPASDRGPPRPRR